MINLHEQNEISGRTVWKKNMFQQIKTEFNKSNHLNCSQNNQKNLTNPSTKNKKKPRKPLLLEKLSVII